MKNILSFHKKTTGIQLTRRDLLKGCAVLSGVLATGSLLSLLAPSRAWAIETQLLSQLQAENLLEMGKILYPHKDLPDAVYAFLVKDLDTQANQSTDIAQLIHHGISQLNAKSPFLNLSSDEKLHLLRSIEHTPFFELVRKQCITSIYDNELAYAHFGYEGETWSKGGYISRGFNDIKWLPLPPESVSPRF